MNTSMDVSLLDLQMDDSKSPNTTTAVPVAGSIPSATDPFTDNFPAPSELDLSWNLLELEECNSSGEASAEGSNEAPPATVGNTVSNSNSNTNNGRNVSAADKAKEKLAQRKLRNKESARRYREKQVARRRQLENFTRTLAEQNRELEALHDRLLALTCQRRMRTSQTPPQQPINYSQPLPLQ